MARERKNAPPHAAGRVRIRSANAQVAGIRRRAIEASGELTLSEEDLRALADAGIDPEEVQAVARADHDEDDVSIFDRPTAREDVEGLLEPDDYPG